MDEELQHSFEMLNNNKYSKKCIEECCRDAGVNFKIASNFFLYYY